LLEGIRTSASGMLPRATKQEILANNLANIETAGYKRDRVVFRQQLDAQISAAASEGQEVAGEQVLIDFSQGPLEKTDRPLDLALDGKGFFTVETPNGLRYTRAGNFTIDPDGYLVTPSGERVLGEGGPIRLGEGDVRVSEDGEIWQGNVAVDRLQLTEFDDLSKLVKEGHNLFRTSDPTEKGKPAETTKVLQGYLEGSNVNPLEEMVEMMVVYRNFEAEQKAVQVQDETLGKAINDLPKF